MNKAQLIACLEEMGELLEIDGANSFKVGAFPKAARILADTTEDIALLLEQKRLTDIAGIGKGLEQKIREFADSGTIGELEELRTKYPPGVRAISRLPGLGAKKTRVLFDELGITSIDELKVACEQRTPASIKGFGAKTCDKILEGIEKYTRFAGRHRLDSALRVAEALLEKLRNHPGVLRAEMAGSLRRWRETVKDIDLVVATDKPAEVMAFFTALEGVREVIGAGDTKASVFLHAGIQADLRCVSPAEYPFALLHFTGSKEHNTELRALAKEKNLKLNEYGLFPAESETSLPAEDEAGIYRLLGLVYTPPEMREGMGEVDAAKTALPCLVQQKDLLGLVHMHTHYSDGKPTAEEYAQYAATRGLRWMGISDHSQSLAVAHGLTEERVLQQRAEIDAVNAMYADCNVRLLKGIESDILEDGRLDYRPEFLSTFEFIVASVHSHFNLTEKEQTARVRRALDDPHTTILGHMTGRLLLSRDGFAIDQMEIITAAARNRVAIEINGNPRRLDLDWRLVRHAADSGVRIALSPDAHTIEGLEDTRFALAMARKGWLTRDNILNCLGTEEFLAFVYSRR